MLGDREDGFDAGFEDGFDVGFEDGFDASFEDGAGRGEMTLGLAVLRGVDPGLVLGRIVVFGLVLGRGAAAGGRADDAGLPLALGRPVEVDTA